MKSSVYKKLADGRYVAYDPHENAYFVLPAEHVPPLVPLRLGQLSDPDAEHRSRLAVLLAMIEFQRRAHAAGDPEASKPYLEALGKLLNDPGAARKAMRLSWRAAESKTGHLKAVGEGEHAGQVLYGERAAAALRYQERLGNRDSQGRAVAIPEPAEKFNQWRKAGVRAREILTKFANGEHSPEDLKELPEHLPYLPVDRLSTARSILRAQFKGVRGRMAMVDGLMDHIRVTLDAEDRAKAAAGEPGGVELPHPMEESASQPIAKELTKEEAKELMKSISPDPT